MKTRRRFFLLSVARRDLEAGFLARLPRRRLDQRLARIRLPLRQHPRVFSRAGRARYDFQLVALATPHDAARRRFMPPLDVFAPVLSLFFRRHPFASYPTSARLKPIASIFLNAALAPREAAVASFASVFSHSSAIARARPIIIGSLT